MGHSARPELQEGACGACVVGGAEGQERVNAALRLTHWSLDRLPVSLSLWLFITNMGLRQVLCLAQISYPITSAKMPNFLLPPPALLSLKLVLPQR